MSRSIFCSQAGHTPVGDHLHTDDLDQLAVSPTPRGLREKTRNSIVIDRLKPYPALHIGLPRTGTKLLQWHLFSVHPQIHYLGIYDGNPKFRDRRPYANCRDQHVQRMMQGLVIGNLSRPDLGASRLLAKERALVHLEQGRVPMWSQEILSVGSEKSRRLRAENLWRIFGPCRVLLTLRHPVGLVESTCRLMLRRENQRRSSGRTWYKPLDEWFHDQLEGEVFPHLDYLRTYEIYRELFGEESVKVVLFEDLRADSARFVRDICEFYRVDPDALGPWLQNRSENSGPSSWQVQLIKRVAESRIAEAIAQTTTPRMRAWILRPPRTKSGDRIQRLSVRHQDRIAEITASGNRQLAELTGLPLESHGYPMD